MEKAVIIFGAKGIARAALEIFRSNGIEVYGFLDDDTKTHQTEIDTIPVLGKTDDHGFLKLIGQKCEAFVATDENAVRKKLVNMLMDKRKTMPMNAVHKLAQMSESAVLGHGNFINARVVLGAGSRVGQHCILNSGAVIEHNVAIGDFVQIGAGTVVNADVSIEKEAYIGSGALIVSGVKIGKKARVGAGSVVVSDVADGETVFGNPAVKIEK
ncbi:MAG: acetyltransferase [Cyclobacteriaceae bacterium]